MRRGRAVLAFLVTTSTAGVVRAGNSSPSPLPGSSPSTTALPLELSWSAPEDCPQADAVVHRVEEILKGPPLSPMTVRADGAVRRSSSTRFELELTIQAGDDEDQRHIDASSCSALAEASAVVIALAIDRARTSGPSSSDAGTAASAPPPVDSAVSTSSPSPKAPALAAKTEEPVRLAVALSPALDVGTLPKAAGGLILDAGLRVRRFRFGVDGSAWLPQDVEFEPVTHAGATFTMLTVGGWAAYMLPAGPISLGPAVGVDATFVHLEGFGIRAPVASWTSWPTVVLGARAEARLTRWLGLTARVALTLPIDPPTFTLGSSSTAVSLHEPSVISGRFSVGPEFVFP